MLGILNILVQITRDLNLGLSYETSFIWYFFYNFDKQFDFISLFFLKGEIFSWDLELILLCFKKL